MPSGKEVNPASELPVAIDSKGFRVDIAGLPIPLKRTFGALDRLIATPIEALADSVEKKLKCNLDSHVEAVQKHRGKKGQQQKIPNPSVKATKAIGEWAPRASEIDPEEKDLSAVWRAVLDEILEESNEAEDLLRVVQALPSSDIRYFISLYSGVRTDIAWSKQRHIRYFLKSLEFWGDDPSVSRLRTHGLLTKLFNVSFMIVILALFGVGIYGLYTITGGGKWETNKQIEFGLLAGIIIILLLFLFNTHRPTYLGRQLGKLYREYAETDDMQKK